MTKVAMKLSVREALELTMRWMRHLMLVPSWVKERLTCSISAEWDRTTKPVVELVRNGRRMLDDEGTYLSEVQRGEDLLASWPCNRWDVQEAFKKHEIRAR